MWAQTADVIITFASPVSISNGTLTNFSNDNGNLSVTMTKGSAQNAPAISSSQLRLYAEKNSGNGGSATITSSSKDMAKVVFTFSGTNYTGPNNAVASDYILSGTTGTWEGSARSITIQNNTVGSTDQIRITQIDIYYSTAVSNSVATPTFSPIAGTYYGTQNVEISCSTTGATIYYTTDGNDPTTSSSVYSTPIEVSSDMTIKALGVMTGLDNSSVAEADYIIKPAVTGYNIDFEDALDAYSDWTITNFTQDNTITANGGSYYAKTNGTNTASIQTKETINNPGTFTCYVSKIGTNTNANSYWKVQVSSNGSNWTDVVSHAAAVDITEGTWTEITADLRSYNDVYVRLYYDGTSAVRTVDDISLTMNNNATVVSLALSGDYTTTFVEGSAFNHEGVVVTATYSDNTTADVTAQATFSDLNMTQVGNQTVTVSFGGKTATYTITITALPTHTATFSVNGTTSTQDFKEGAAINFPADPADIAGMKFMGWAEAVISGTQAEAPTFISSATMGTEDVTFYAVFAAAEGTPASLTKMKKGDTFAADDNVVIVAQINESTSYALYQETQSNSYVKNYTFTENAQTINNDEKNWLTVEAGSTTGTWKLGDATNGYLYTSGSNNLSIDGNNSTEWTLEEGTNDDTFKLKGGSNNRYISCRTDLSNDNVNLFRLAGSSPAGVYEFSIYKFVPGSSTYSDYCTTVATTKTVTLNDYGYATYCSTSPLDFTNASGYSAWKVTGINIGDNYTGTITFEKITGAVKEGTGIFLMGEANDEITLNIADSGDPLNDNWLEGFTVATQIEADDLYYGLKGDTFVKVSGGTVPAGKALLHADDPTGGGEARLTFVFIDESAGISEIKEMRNVGNEKVYNLNGQRVSKATKGMYIVNGKKFINK